MSKHQLRGIHAGLVIEDTERQFVASDKIEVWVQMGWLKDEPLATIELTPEEAIELAGELIRAVTSIERDSREHA